jgi:hypothetical protein
MIQYTIIPRRRPMETGDASVEAGFPFSVCSSTGRFMTERFPIEKRAF